MKPKGNNFRVLNGSFWINGKCDKPANFAILLKKMVGAWGFEPQTPTVSKEHQAACLNRLVIRPDRQHRSRSHGIGEDFQYTDPRTQGEHSPSISQGHPVVLPRPASANQDRAEASSDQVTMLRHLLAWRAPRTTISTNLRASSLPPGFLLVLGSGGPVAAATSNMGS